MKLGFGLSFDDLYARGGLVRLDASFVFELAARDPALHNRLVTARAAPDSLPDKEHSQLLIDVAPHLEDFLAELFAIRGEVTTLKEAHFALAPLYSCKRLFVQRRAAKALKPEEAALLDGATLRSELITFFGGAVSPFERQNFELTFARNVMAWLDAPTAHEQPLAAATRYAAWALHSPSGRELHGAGILFRLPRKTDPLHLLALDTEERNGVTMLRIPRQHNRCRDGFSLTDDGGTLAKALDETNYCIWCHNQGKDSCAKGLKESGVRSSESGVQSPKSGTSSAELRDIRRSETTTPRSEGERSGGDSSPPYKINPLGITLAGCPLEEKISEMNFLKSEGIPIGALATVIIDNPMCAGTGHRICNDCMKSCIYQKQEPVNIPQAETRTLRDVLDLSYGFEIYALLTRWNPLNLHRPLPKPDSGRRVLVAGLGPAGYTLAHHLLNDGHTVVGIDGLKIEPLPPEICGVTALGAPAPFAPVRDIANLFERLDERTLAGFGGVAEYGITVRWDKNFLKVIRLLLERRRSFAMIGGVRFGSTLELADAFALGFDHVALCMGAGSPTIIDMPNGLARGVRTASDFLMALQLTGAAKKESIANLQLRMPAVVIGGGLTAIDTATEALAYYPVQVEKFLTRYETLAGDKGEAAVRAAWSKEETEIAEEFLRHARLLRAERLKPCPNVPGLLNEWGGATMVYRRRLVDAPSYRLNHEEVEKALEEGIRIAESLEPVRIEVDGWGHAEAVVFKSSESGVQSSESPVKLRTPNSELHIPARTVLVAAGTSPNTMLAREDPAHFTLDGRYFRALGEDGKPVTPERLAKPSVPRMLTAIEGDGRAVSFFGDLHPSFAGNVVKAMGSAKQGYPVLSRMLAKLPPRVIDVGFLRRINEELRATVHAVVHLTPTIVEVVVKSPLAARRFAPGQFYRLQNFEANALRSSECRVQSAAVDFPNPELRTPTTALAMEGLALTGASVDREKGFLSTIVLEMGGSSDLCRHLKPGEPVVLMGPTGTPTEIPEGGTVLLLGGGLGNAVLFSIGRACREKGAKVLYFAGYRREIDRYKIEEIERASDAVVWCCDEPHSFTPSRPQDKAFHGNLVAAIMAYASGELGPVTIRTMDSDRLLAIGSDRMMAAVAAARHTVLKPFLKPGHIAVGSINSPMQCMMKEICAQCLQQHVDPVTGTVRYVYSCFNQDQLLDQVSFPFLNERLRQNSLQEKLTAQWVDRCLRSLGLRQKVA